jgi:hypothetical protein
VTPLFFPPAGRIASARLTSVRLCRTLIDLAVETGIYGRFKFWGRNMRLIPPTLLSLLLCGVAVAQGPLAQESASHSLRKGTWELGLFGGGGAGLASVDDTRFVYLGGRVGRVLIQDRFSGWRRGNLEWAIDLMPVYTVFALNNPVYGGSFKPAIWQWNFTSGKKIAPYASIAGGILFSTSNLPPGDTSWVNFSPQVAFGAHIFVNSGRAVLLEGAYVHHSNSGLGTFNPGYNASILFTVGCSWFRNFRVSRD